MAPVIDYRTNEAERVALRPGPKGATCIGEFVIGPEYVALVDGSRLVNIVRREDVRMIHVRHGFLARHPAMMMVISVVLILLTIVGLVALGLLILGLRAPARGFIYMIANIALVPFCLRAGTQRGYYLDVEATQGTVRLAPDQQTRKIEVIETAAGFAERLGYPVSRDADLPPNA